MTDHDHPDLSSLRLPLTRRDMLRITGGAALTTAVAGAIGLATGDGAALAGQPKFGAPEAGLRLASKSGELLIRDGSPYSWLSPDIWVVPGTDPYGAPGSPAGGDTAYVWTRVRNTGTGDATGVLVRFYWADPSFDMYYSGIHLIGTALADIPAGTEQDVLCVVPWSVEYVNGGHECLVVVASLPEDPPLPDLVDPPAYPQVAQRNLTVLAGPDGDRRVALLVTALPKQDRLVRVTTEVGAALPDDVLKRYGLAGLRPAQRPDAVQFGLSLEPAGVGAGVLDVKVPAGQSRRVYATVRGASKLGDGEYQLLHVVERAGRQLLGGVSFIVTAHEKGGR